MTQAPPEDAAADDATLPYADEAPGRHRRSGVRNSIEWVVIIVGALLAALVIKTFLIQAFYIPSGSMEPTLYENDRVLVNKLSYRLHDINRGDVVVFERPKGTGGDVEIKDLIKRVVALEGETIEGRDGRVYIDGKPLAEPYLRPGSSTENLEKQTIPQDHVWVMGDNRGNSKDSRVFAAIPEDTVVGRAFVRVWPLGDLSLL